MRIYFFLTSKIVRFILGLLGLPEPQGLNLHELPWATLQTERAVQVRTLEVSGPMRHRILALRSLKGCPAGKSCLGSELPLDAEQLIELRHSFAPAGRTGLQLSGAYRHCQVCNSGIFRLTRAVRNETLIVMLLRQLDGI